MSSNEEVEIKGGHPPAMKVAGVRIPQRHRGLDDKEGAQAKHHKDSEDDHEEEDMPVSKSPPKPPMMVSGVVAKVDKDFPTAAVKHTHEKPVPTHDSRPSHAVKPGVIQQPRK
ncbi:death-associated protein 1-like [Portunus trituberculatus]|uniref:death-associated protein 1-like n=1 Tax=Portunus trituberculatus TaxID=210409 RepID=UPI001E1CB5A8|nr:death-associated protein 1-like [Portunus trituberculatus]